MPVLVKHQDLLIHAKSSMCRIWRFLSSLGHKRRSQYARIYLRSMVSFPQSSHPKEGEWLCFELDGVQYLAQIQTIHPEMTHLDSFLFHQPIEAYLCPLFSDVAEAQSIDPKRETCGRNQSQPSEHISFEKTDSKKRSGTLLDSGSHRHELPQSDERSFVVSGDDEKHSSPHLTLKAQALRCLSNQKKTFLVGLSCRNISIALYPTSTKSKQNP